MPLDGGKLICLNDDGSRGKVVLANGSIFRIGYLMNNDHILHDAKAMPTHCEICCDAWDRITIHNKSDEYPVKLNDEVVHIKSRLFNGSKITILKTTFLWEFERDAKINKIEHNLTALQDEVTPSRQEDEKPAPYSCPDLRFHREITKRLTIHNFAYFIHQNEEGNTSSELDNTETGMSSISEEVEDKQEEADKQLKPTEMKKIENTKTEDERCMTPDLAPQNNSLTTTPITQILNSTANKTTRSNEKINNIVTSCKMSDVLITSYTPRETGVRIDKSFTALVKPKMTPKSLYSTPKSLLYDTMTECERSRNMTSNFTTPATSKKELMHNTSMHVYDLTTPKKLAPASPMPKSILKKSAVKMTPRQLSLKEHNTITPSNAVPLFRNNSSSMESGLSVQCVDSSPEVIELSGEEESTCKLNTSQKLIPPPLSKHLTPKRTPQTLRQRVLLNSAKKTCMTVDRNQQISNDIQKKLLAKRLSLCTPPRRNVNITSTPFTGTAGGNILSTSTPKSKDSKFMASTSLHGICKSAGLTGCITKNRKSISLSRSMNCVKSKIILAKACKTLTTPTNKMRLTIAAIQSPLTKSTQKSLKTSHDFVSKQQSNSEENNSLNVTFSPVKEHCETLENQSLNSTFSINKNLDDEEENAINKERDEIVSNAELQVNNDIQIKKEFIDEINDVQNMPEDEKKFLIGECAKNPNVRETDELLKEISEILNMSDELQRKRESHTINKENDVNVEIIKGQIEFVEKEMESVVPSMPLILVEMEKKKKNKPKTTPLQSPNLCGIRELMQTQKILNHQTPNFTGMKNLLRIPKSYLIHNDNDDDDDNQHLDGLKFMMQTPPTRRASMTADIEIRTCTSPFSRNAFNKSLLNGTKPSIPSSTDRLVRRRSVGGFETELQRTVISMMPTNTADEVKIEINSKKETFDDKLTKVKDVGNEDLDDYVEEEEISICNTESDKKIKIALEKEGNDDEDDEDFIPETQSTDFDEKHNFDCFLKSPRAKNLMVSTRQTDILDKTDDDMNSSEDLEFGDIFKTMDNVTVGGEKTHTSNNKTKDIVDEIEQEKELQNLSSEEKFDKLIGNDDSSSSSFVVKTPIVTKVYEHHKSVKTTFSPFTAVDVISDLPKTDIEVWVNSLEVQKTDNDELVDILDNEILKSSTPTLEVEQMEEKSDISGIMPLDKSDESSVLMEQLRLSDDSDIAESEPLTEFDEDEEIPETQMPCIRSSPAKSQNKTVTENIFNEIDENETMLNLSENKSENSESKEKLYEDETEASATEVKNDHEDESLVTPETQIDENETMLNLSENKSENNEKFHEDETKANATEVQNDHEEESILVENIVTYETQIDDDGDDDLVIIEGENGKSINETKEEFVLRDVEPTKNKSFEIVDENSLEEISHIIEHEEEISMANITHTMPEDNVEKGKNLQDEIIEIKKHDDSVVNDNISEEDEEVNLQDEIHEEFEENKENEESNIMLEKEVAGNENLNSEELENLTETDEEPVEKLSDCDSDMKTFENENHGQVLGDEENNDLTCNLALENEIDSRKKDENAEEAISDIVQDDVKKENKSGCNEKVLEKIEITNDLLFEEMEKNRDDLSENSNDIDDETAEEPSVKNVILESENIFDEENSIDENSKITNETDTIRHENEKLTSSDENDDNAAAEIKIIESNEDNENMLKNNAEMDIDQKTVAENLIPINNDEEMYQNKPDVSLSTEIDRKEIIDKCADINLIEKKNIKNLNNSFENNQIKSKNVKFENSNSSDMSNLKPDMDVDKSMKVDAEATFTMKKISPTENSSDGFKSPSGSENSCTMSDESVDASQKNTRNKITLNIDVPKISVTCEKPLIEKKDAIEELKVEQKNSRNIGQRKRGGSEPVISKELATKNSSAKETKSKEEEIVSPASTTSTRSGRITKKVKKDFPEKVVGEPIEKRTRRGKNAKQLDAIDEATVSEAVATTVDVLPETPSSTILTANVEKVGRRGRKPSVTDSPLPHKTLQQALLKATLSASTPSNKEKLRINDLTAIQQDTEMSLDISAVKTIAVDDKANEELSRPRTRGRPRATTEESQVISTTSVTRTRRGRKLSEKTETPLKIKTTLVAENTMTTKADNDEADSQLIVVGTTGRTRRAQKANVTMETTVDTTSTRTTRRARGRNAETVEKELEKKVVPEEKNNNKKSTTKKDKVFDEIETEKIKKTSTRGRQAKTETTKNAPDNLEKEEKVEKIKKEPVKRRGRKASEKSEKDETSTVMETKTIETVVETNEKSISIVEPVKKRGRKASEKSVDEPLITKTKKIETPNNEKPIDELIKTRSRRGAKTTKKEEKTIESIPEEEIMEKTDSTDAKHSSDSDVHEKPIVKAAKTIKAKRTAANKHPVEKAVQEVKAEEKIVEVKVGRATRGRKNAAAAIMVNDGVEELVSPPKKRSTRARK